MAAEGKKISTLVIRVDLGCTKCYDKIRQVLCKYHCLIISKTFDEKNNTVTITGYFHPCKFSKKLCCKAGKAIISIEEVKPPPPAAPAPAPAPAPVVADPPKVIPEPDPPKVIPVVVPVQPAAEPPKKEPEPVSDSDSEPVSDSDSEPEPGPGPQPGTGIPYFIPAGYPLPPPAMPPQFGVCCGPCYQGIGGGPCHHQPPPEPYYHDCYYGKPVQPPPCSCGCGGYRRCSSNPCEYFTDENPNSCNVM